MRGLMQHDQLMISDLLRHAARHHPHGEIVSRMGDFSIHRQSWPETERRARRLANALAEIGVSPGDRVATLAWNGFRHVELYFAISGSGAVVNTVNPRLAPDDIAYIIAHAEDGVLFAETDFAGLVAGIAPKLTTVLRHVVFLCDEASLPDVTLPDGIAVSAYESLLDAASETYDWPRFDERTASGLCYTSGTTGKPKGVLYTHRSTSLLAMAVIAADACGLTAMDRLMPVVPMFHVNAWSLPYAAAASGTTLVMPGRFMDGESLSDLISRENVTMSAGVPTIWLGVLDHLRKTGMKLPSLKRLLIGGSACPEALFEGFEPMGIEIRHAWGMTESSPLATIAAPVPGADPETARRQKLSQGRVMFGIDIRARRDGVEVPWDDASPGDIEVKGHWVTTAYYGMKPGTTEDGWFPTGDVGMIDRDGFVRLTDRTKDLIKSGGEWISSIDLENIALAHPAVAEAAAIAAKHPKWDERPLLIVALRPGVQATREEILKVYDGKVARWAVPDDVIFVDELPHGATGKLLKTSLRDRYADHLIEGRAAE